MFHQPARINSWLVMEALAPAERHQLHQVPVAHIVLRQNRQVILPLRPALLVCPANVELAAEDGLDIMLLTSLLMLDVTESIAVLSHCDGRHIDLGSPPRV